MRFRASAWCQQQTRRTDYLGNLAQKATTFFFLHAVLVPVGLSNALSASPRW